MNTYRWIVLTNCVAGGEARFEEWYEKIHIPDLLRVPGIVGATRGRLGNIQTVMGADGVLELSRVAGQNYRFLAIYALKTDDPESVLAEVVRRANTPEMMISADLLEAHTILYQDV